MPAAHPYLTAIAVLTIVAFFVVCIMWPIVRSFRCRPKHHDVHLARGQGYVAAVIPEGKRAVLDFIDHELPWDRRMVTTYDHPTVIRVPNDGSPSATDFSVGVIRGVRAAVAGLADVTWSLGEEESIDKVKIEWHAEVKPLITNPMYDPGTKQERAEQGCPRQEVKLGPGEKAYPTAEELDKASTAILDAAEKRLQCDCPVCHGEGFVGSDGETCPCIKAGCRKRHKREEYLRRNGLKDDRAFATGDTVSTPVKTEQAKMTFRFSYYVAGQPQPEKVFEATEKEIEDAIGFVPDECPHEVQAGQLERWVGKGYEHAACYLRHQNPGIREALESVRKYTSSPTEERYELVGYDRNDEPTGWVKQLHMAPDEIEVKIGFRPGSRPVQVSRRTVEALGCEHQGWAVTLRRVVINAGKESASV